MDPLADVDDLEGYGVDVSPLEADSVTRFLEAASTAVREAAGVPISEVTSIVAVTGWGARFLRLPGGPVTDVSSVTVDGDAFDEWKLVHGTYLWRSGRWGNGYTPLEVVVTYTHGYATVPADIVNMVCSMAAAALVKIRELDDDGQDAAGAVAARDPSVSSETITVDDFSATVSYQQQDPTLDLTTRFALPAATRHRLRERFAGSSIDTVEVLG